MVCSHVISVNSRLEGEGGVIFGSFLRVLVVLSYLAAIPKKRKLQNSSVICLEVRAANVSEVSVASSMVTDDDTIISYRTFLVSSTSCTSRFSGLGRPC